MAQQFVTFDDAQLEPGKFYEVRVNRDSANAVIEVPMQTVQEVENLTLYTTDGTYNTPLRVLERVNTTEGPAHVPVDFLPMYLPGNKIQIMFNPPFTGVIIKN